jgi:hypothetical protein
MASYFCESVNLLMRFVITVQKRNLLYGVNFTLDYLQNTGILLHFVYVQNIYLIVNLVNIIMYCFIFVKRKKKFFFIFTLASSALTESCYHLGTVKRGGGEVNRGDKQDAP